MIRLEFSLVKAHNFAFLILTLHLTHARCNAILESTLNCHQRVGIEFATLSVGLSVEELALVLIIIRPFNLAVALGNQFFAQDDPITRFGLPIDIAGIPRSIRQQVVLNLIPIVDLADGCDLGGRHRVIQRSLLKEFPDSLSRDHTPVEGLQFDCGFDCGKRFATTLPCFQTLYLSIY